MSEKVKPEFFEFDIFPSGCYDGNYYVRLKDDNRYVPLKDESLSYKSALTSLSTIEILWPDNAISQHNIFIETEINSFYDSQSDRIIDSTFYDPFISISYHGTSLGKVMLTSIKGIKIRILTADKSVSN